MRRGPLSFRGRRLAPAFDIEEVTIPTGAERRYIAVEWLDAIVIVERGRIELETIHGWRVSFVSGDVLCLDALPLRTLRNSGHSPLLLVSIRRARRSPSPVSFFRHSP